MKFSEFETIDKMLRYFGLSVEKQEFMNFQAIPEITLPAHLREDIIFSLANRGDTDMEFFACEALIFPILREAWKRNPRAKLYSHPQIRYEDLILIPDYVVAPKNITGEDVFQKPLLVTVEAKHDDYDLGWIDAYRQLVVCSKLNKNPDIPIYAIVSIGTGWQIGKLDKNIIYRHPLPIGLENANKLLGVLDFIFADCIKTAEKFDLY